MRRHLFALSVLLTTIIPSVAQELPMDYSYCGYHRSEMPIPSAKVVVYVQPSGDDDAAQLQAAIDYVSQQKADKLTGLRGAVLLGEGTFSLSEPLRIRTSGVVLRGSGREKTILRKMGYDRGALIYIEGTHEVVVKDTFDVNDTKAGSITLNIQRSTLNDNTPIVNNVQRSTFSVQRIMIWRPSTQEWIDHLGCASFGGGKRMGYWAWHPGDIDLRWNRQILAVQGNVVTLDAPITCDIDSRYGGAKAIIYEQPGLISECGIENLSLESDYDRARPLDEDHCWDGVYMADAENCWVRMVNFRHFAGSAVVIQKSAQQITVEDCQSLDPVSEIGGFRRRTFLTFGEMVLFQRCYSEHGINDFAVGHTAPGPNAFVQCESFESFGPSGAISSWAPGILFDIVNIDGNDLVFKNWELEKFGAGWSTANSTLWQSTASGLFCYSPDSLNKNYSIGCWGQIQGNGEYSDMNEHVRPYSLYASQLEKRLGRDVSAQCRVLERNTNASSSPTIEEAMQLAEEALQPRTTMQMWIDSAVFTGDISQGKLKPFVYQEVPSRVYQSNHYEIVNGWLTKNNSVLVGGKHQTPWWNGRTTDAAMAKAKYALTRFVPGQETTGGTDRVDSVISQMQHDHTLLFSQNYGLWTDRRRDDHERIRRKNGDAWAPFYEQPFARTGTLNIQHSTLNDDTSNANNVQRSTFNVQCNLAWDGMTKYDLTTLNKWYFWRLQQFAKKSESIGFCSKTSTISSTTSLRLVPIGWIALGAQRTTSTIRRSSSQLTSRATSVSLRPPCSMILKIPSLRELHRQYIRQSLDAFKGQPNVIHSIGEEFTGPLHFVQFWLDVIAEWEQENGPVLVDLAVNKDVQDAILKDPVRSKIVDIIDIEQWFYHNKGEYAPPGGVNMAQRQYMRKIRTGSARFEDVYRAVSEYRKQYPDKAVIYSAQKAPELCWAALMAGGSCAAIPVTDKAFLAELSQMVPRPSFVDDFYMLSGDNGYLFYRASGGSSNIDLGQGKYTIYSIDEKTGTVTRLRDTSSTVTLESKGIYWLKKK